MSKSEYAVVVSSCDAFYDLWPIFFHFLLRHTPTALSPIYLISNHAVFASDRVKTITVGEDRHWASNLQQALAVVPTDYIVYLQDDYLLQSDFPLEQIERAVIFLQRQQGHYVGLIGEGVESEPTDDVGFIRVLPTTRWMVHLQAAVWRRQSLLDLLRPGETPWQAESSLNRQAKAWGTGFYGLSGPGAKPLEYVQAIKGGFWQAEAVAYCRAHGIEPDLVSRPSPPSGQALWFKWYRSWLKWQMRRRRNRTTVLEKEIQPWVKKD